MADVRFGRWLRDRPHPIDENDAHDAVRRFCISLQTIEGLQPVSIDAIRDHLTPFVESVGGAAPRTWTRAQLEAYLSERKNLVTGEALKDEDQEEHHRLAEPVPGLGASERPDPCRA